MSNLGEDINSLIKNHLPFVILTGIIYIIGITTVIISPELDPIKELNAQFFVFGVSLQATLFILAIGIFLLYRWIAGGRENTPNLVWGISFLLYSILFIVFMFSAFRDPSDPLKLIFEWSNMDDPLYFFMWRQIMIWWVALMFIGIAMILIPEKPFWQFVPAMIIIVISYLWFVYGLFITNGGDGDIEMTMYGFLFFIWIPMCAIIAYTFHLFSKTTGLTSPRWITFGFIGLGLTYSMWAPWHHAAGKPTYFIWFFLFVTSLVPILVGFLMLPLEQESKT